MSRPPNYARNAYVPKNNNNANNTYSSVNSPQQYPPVRRVYAPNYYYQVPQPVYYAPIQPMYAPYPNMYPIENAFAQMQLAPGYTGAPIPYGNNANYPSREQGLIGKVHDVFVKEYNDKGVLVEFRNMVTGLLQWTAFSRSVQLMEPEARLRFCEQRIPVGSQFNVYVNSADESGMMLTLAMKSAPILNYPALSKDDKSILGKSSYRYLIIMDMEATCDYSPNPVVHDNNAEIIEFPWMVLDTETLEIIYQKQIHVKPSDMRGITPYCRVLTGITEQTLENACTFADAIKQFESYVSTLPEGSFKIVTDGVWDLKQVADEAARKGIKLGNYYSQYINLKQEFRNFLPIFPWKPHEPPLHIMLQALSLKFDGTPHRGIDDCLAIMQVVKTILRRGHEFRETVAISDASDPAYIQFSHKAPPNSWICHACTEQYSRPTDKDVAIWNKPFANTCRFCKSPPTAPKEATV